MLKILWADDQVEVAKSFAEILSSIEAQIDFVDNGELAIEKLENQTYDLLLLDLAMPPMRWGGLWVLEELRSRSIDVTTIVVSGEGSQPETIKALRLGAADYVTKEQLSNELPQQITSVLEKRGEKYAVQREIDGGESDILEFKSTLRMNLHSKKPDRDLELAVLKSISGFLNSKGGTLFIGVADDGKVVGIETDNFPNNDKFQLHFFNLLREAIGAEYGEFIHTTLSKLDNGSIFRINCRPSNRPVFVKWKGVGESQHQDLFFVRNGPQTERLGTKQAIAYIGDHFNKIN